MTTKQEVRALRRKLYHLNRAIAALEVLDKPRRGEGRGGIRAGCPVVSIQSLRKARARKTEAPKRPPVSSRAIIIAFPALVDGVAAAKEG